MLVAKSIKKETELVGGLCPVHKTKPELIKEDVWFFKLSAFQEKINELIESGQLEILPRTRRNEVVSFIESGLEDIAISRSKVEWGIPLPWDEKQTIYVWVDALLYYYSATIVGEKPELFPPDLHFVGKDILRFHAVIWPALLLAAGLDTPKRIAVHGFFTINGDKMSKTLGNVIKPQELIDRFGVDATRYLLLSQFPFGSDGDFSLKKLEESYTSDLVNGLGNLLQRTLVLAQKLSVPLVAEGKVNPEFDSLKNLDFYTALTSWQTSIHKVNQEIDKSKPWTLTPGSVDAKMAVANFLEHIWLLQKVIEPFMPETAKKIGDQLTTGQPKPLFPRLTK